MVRMFGYVGASRLRQRSSWLVILCAVAALACFVLALLSRHSAHFAGLHSYAGDFQLIGFVFLLAETWSIRRADRRTKHQDEER